MARNDTSHKSSLFLLELIMAILFFSIASAVCVQLFVKSHLLSKQAEILSIAVNECSDAAEIIYSADTETEVLERLRNAYPDFVHNNNQFRIPYSTTHQTVVEYHFEENASEIESYISFEEISSVQEIYHLSIVHHLKEETHE